MRNLLTFWEGWGGFAPPYNDLTQFILGQHANMPDYLGAPMLAATLVFDLSGFVKGESDFTASRLISANV